jgi:5'-nucleotidase
MHPPLRQPAPKRAGFLKAAALTGACTVALALLPALPAYAAPSHMIGAVQGSGATAAVTGTVTVQGVVTADYTGASNYDGYVIQSVGAQADGNPETSDAIFVYLGATPGDTALSAFGIGDLVEVTGTVSEYQGRTQLTQTGVTVITPDAGVSAPLQLTDELLLGDREALEDMLVDASGDYLLASTHNTSQYGELWLTVGDEPLVKSTETTDGSNTAAVDAIAAANAARTLLLDDGWNRTVTASQHTGDQPYLSAGEVVRTGDQVTLGDTPYIFSYGINRWRLQPTTAISTETTGVELPEFTTLNPRPATAPAVGGDVQVAAFNVLNYFTTLTSQNSNARGASNATDFDEQESKIVAAINELDADVVALMEIENSIKLGEAPDEAIAALVAALNDAAGAGTWAYVPTPASLTAETTDFITNAIIYRTASATPVGTAQTITDETVWDNAREPIAQVFQSGGVEFAVVANHFKSKSGTDDVAGTTQQGEFTADRVAQANSLMAFVDTLATENVALLGDFNAYTEEDPAQVITDAGFVDAVSAYAPGQYTYTFDGELGSLDHMFLSPSLDELITDAAVWSINSPEWGAREYGGTAVDASSVFRSSDHDPIVAGFAAEPVTEIDVFGINDFHGHLEQVTSRNATTGVVTVTEPGAAVIGGFLNQAREANPNTLFVSAGDNIGASTFTSFVQNDEPTLDVLNEMGLAFSATGNHEFDKGIDDLTGRVSENSEFPYVVANVYRDGERIFDPYYTQTLGNTTVAFVGAVTEDLPSLVSPAGLTQQGVEVRDIVTEVNAVSAQLTDGDPTNGEADVVILSVHEGAATGDLADATDDSAFGDIVTGVTDVDAIMSAHTHQLYAYEVNGIPVVQAGQYGTNLSHLTITVNPLTGDLVDIAGATIPLTGVSPLPYTPDAEVQAIVDAAVAQANVLGARQLGDIEGDLLRAINTPTAQTPRPENRGGESTIGNFIADVQAWATREQGTDFALMNPGGIRADLRDDATSAAGDVEGVVTYREAATVQPFANTLVAVDLTGEQLKSVLEEQWQPDGSSRPFLKLGMSAGLDYTYDPTAPRGERITAIYVNDELVQADDVFRVAANSFLASGGDNFTTLADGTNRADTGQVDLEAMISWFEEFQTVTAPSDQRAVGVVTNAPDGGYAEGDTVELDLSSLAFTNGEFPEATEVEVTLNGEVVASAPIDRTISDSYDETGRATVSFAFAGAGEYLLTVPGTDTSVALVLVAASDAGSGDGDGDDNGVGAGDGSGSGDSTGGGSTIGDGTSGDRGSLAVTGAEIAPWLIAAILAMIAAGSALVIRGRRNGQPEAEQQ